MSDGPARTTLDDTGADDPATAADDPNGAQFDERSLPFLVVPEVVAFATLCAFLANSLLGDGTFLASYPPWVRAAAFGVAATQCLIVGWVFLDVRRRPEMGPMWVHAAAMPVLNLFGLAAYLAERKRKAGER